jgi:hypothetical protein
MGLAVLLARGRLAPSADATFGVALFVHPAARSTARSTAAVNVCRFMAYTFGRRA